MLAQLKLQVAQFWRSLSNCASFEIGNMEFTFHTPNARQQHRDICKKAGCTTVERWRYQASISSNTPCQTFSSILPIFLPNLILSTHRT